MFDSDVDVVLLAGKVAVDRDEELGLGHFDHISVFVARSVAGNVQRADAVQLTGFVAEDVDAFLEEIVDHDANLGVVARVRDWRAGQDNGVLFLEFDVAVFAITHALQGGAGLALGAGTNDD